MLRFISIIGSIVVLLPGPGCAAHGDGADPGVFLPDAPALPGLHIAYGSTATPTTAGHRIPAGKRPIRQPDELASWLNARYPGQPLSAALGPNRPALVFAPTAESPDAAESAFGDSRPLCIQSQSPFYFDFEAGLRLRYCLPANAIGDARETLQSNLAALLQANSSTLPEVAAANRRLRIFASSPGRLRQSLAPVLYSLDGFRESRLAQWQLSGSRMRFAYTSRNYGERHGNATGIEGDAPTHALPRRFPQAGFAVLVGQTEIHWLYQQTPGSDALIVVAIQDARATQLLRDFLDLLPAATAREIEYAQQQGQPVHAGEIYFRNQRRQHRPLVGERANEFLELHSDQQATFAWLHLIGDAAGTDGPTDAANHTYRPLFLFPHSTWLIERDATLRWNDELHVHTRSAQNSTDPTLSLRRPAHAPGARSLRALPATGAAHSEPGLSINQHCRRDLPEYAVLCANPGWSPAFAQAMAAIETREQTAAPFCTAQDLRLSEINPIGIFVPGHGIDRNGKFIELQAIRTCRSGHVLLQVGSTVLDPGAGRLLGPERPLLFLVEPAALQFFAFAPDRPQPDLAFAPGLRLLNLESARLTAIDLPPLDHARPAGMPPAHIVADLTASTDEADYWTGSGRAVRPDDAFRAVHSLGFGAETPGGSADQMHSLAFAFGPGHGLRPDLSIHNAMSPGVLGHQPALSPDLRLRPRLQIAEVLPAGERLPDNTTRPGAEFLELRLSCPPAAPVDCAPRESDAAEFAAITLAIETLASGDRVRTVLPYPELRAQQPVAGQAHRIVLIRDSSSCFAEHSTERSYSIPALRLPDRAAEYQLTDTHANTTLDRLTISAAEYTALTIPAGGLASARRSHVRTFTDESGLAISGPADGAAALDPLCGTSTRATPGTSGGLAPRLIEVPAANAHPWPASRRWQLYSERGSLWLNWQLSPAPPNSPSSTQNPIHGGPLLLRPGSETPLSIAAPPLPGAPRGAQQFVAIREIPAIPNPDSPPLLTAALFADGAALFIESAIATPASGQHEWLRLCSPIGLAWPEPAAQLQISDRSSTDTIVPARTRFAAGLPLPPDAPGLSQSQRTLEPGQCAILVDPDYNGHPLPWLPADRALWTIASSTAIGNGLSPDEPLSLHWRLPADAHPDAPACPHDDPAGRCYFLNRHPTN